MSVVPFALRRPWLLIRDILVDRERPDLERLRSLREPDRFVWEILPHAARTFSACIAMLPRPAARAAAVGYLYCRILDTYEDLHPESEPREAALRAFAARLHLEALPPAPPIPRDLREDGRDEGHLLLVERVYQTLSSDQRGAVRDLVSSMAEGMCWASRTFTQQEGVLVDEDQLRRYCHSVLGFPVVFAVRLVRAGDLPGDLYDDAMAVGEMVQIANITRDIEKDLRRGIGYHKRLKPWLRVADADTEVVREVRRELLLLALKRVPAYRRTLAAVELGGVSLARASALLMLLFTSRHYRACAQQVGLAPWRVAESSYALLLQVLPAIASRRYTERALARIERDFLTVTRANGCA